jgi:hypothetical protein
MLLVLPNELYTDAAQTILLASSIFDVNECLCVYVHVFMG